MHRAVFLGSPTSLKQAFPPSMRAEIARSFEISGEDIDGAQWVARAADLARAQVVFSTWGMPAMDSGFLEVARELEAVFYAAGSVKNFARPEAYARGIRICSAWQANAIPVAEFTLAAVLLSLKQFWALTRAARETRSFQRGGHIPGAYGSRVGLVSLGAIGRLVAGKLAGFDLEVVAFDPHVDRAAAADLGVRLVPLGELFATADVVSIHSPWLPETENMINAPLLAPMKEGATLINTSRGAVIDEPALCRFLAGRPDVTAILDVTHPEPPKPDSPLYRLPNVQLTPHIAGSMGNEIARMGRWMTDESLRFLKGQPLEHEVDAAALARMA
jgi:phosphoglycerate dehydrogenase-like enzyme